MEVFEEVAIVFRRNAIKSGRVNAVRQLVYSALLAVSGFGPSPASAGEVPALAVEEKIPLGNIAGRIDHLAYDAARQRLYVAELGNDSVGIVDLKAPRQVRTVAGFKEPQGIACETSTDTVYVANGGDGSLRMFRGADFSPVGTVDLDADADNVRADPTARRIYAGHGDGAIAVIDAVTRKRVADIPLKGHPESFQLEANGPRIFVNVPDAGVIQVLSRETGSPVASWPTEDFHANYPLALDAANRRVLSVFRHPARLQAFDTASGARLSGVEACGDADDLFIDVGRSRVYVICGQGTVDTYQAAGAAFTRIARLSTSAGSRTGLYLPDLDRLVVAIRAAGREPAAVWVLRPESTAEAR